jgi:DNA-binding LacI/PurR family transcriptional regulator
MVVITFHMDALDLSTSAGQVYRRMLRHVRMHRLEVGTILPPQPQWQQELGCGTTTFNKAMRMLEAHGVVRRRRSAGTTLLRTAPDRRIQWSVGVCMPKLPTVSAVYPTLLQFLLLHLQEAGCQLHIYRFNRSTPLRYYNRLDDFDSLKEDVEAGRLDGLLNISRLGTRDHAHLKRLGVVSCQLIAHHRDEPGVATDTPEMIRQAVTLLHDKGCRKIALAYPDSDACHESYGDAHQHAFAQAMAELRQPPLEFPGPEFAAGGQSVARQLLQLPPNQRPDALVCIRDDHFALGLTQVLRQDPAYRPAITSQASHQAPLPFFLPVYRFEIDLEEVAKKGVHLLVEQLQSPRQTPTRVYVTSRLNEPQAMELPAKMMDMEYGSKTTERPCPALERMMS